MKKILLSFFTLCSLLISITFPAWAELEAGLGIQSNQGATAGELKLGYRLSGQWEIRAGYDTADQVLAPGVIYFLSPAAPVSPYLGVEIGSQAKLVAGLEYDISKWLPSTAVSVEIKGAPGDLPHTTALGIALNYRFPLRPSGPRPVSESGDPYLLAQLITAEAGEEPYEGQVAAGAVVVNRMKTALFPKTVKKVIYEPAQFKGAATLWAVKPTVTALQAAKDALAGRDPSNGALYFYNPATASPQGLRFFSRLKVTARIGHHVFAK